MTSNNLIWLDMEMTGLDVKKDRIMEIACVITDKDLNIIATAPEYIIHQPEELLRDMNEWCVKTHGESGLTEACRTSEFSENQVEEEIVKFLEKHVKPRECPLAGNSVYMDKYFLMEQMPILAEFFHYRLVDVSTVKEMCRRWSPKIFWNAPAKKLPHRALGDILESIEEMKYYKRFLFTSGDESNSQQF
ncbi:oligoribonuclease [Sergentomyia squamirostris]